MLKTSHPLIFINKYASQYLTSSQTLVYFVYCVFCLLCILSAVQTAIHPAMMGLSAKWQLLTYIFLIFSPGSESHYPYSLLISQTWLIDLQYNAVQFKCQYSKHYSSYYGETGGIYLNSQNTPCIISTRSCFGESLASICVYMCVLCAGGGGSLLCITTLFRSLVQKRHNSSASARELCLFALTHRNILYHQTSNIRWTLVDH